MERPTGRTTWSPRVRLHVINPKGTELNALQPVSYRYAEKDADIVDVMTSFWQTMTDRKRTLAEQGRRTFEMSRETPLDVLVIDELGAVTGYGDRSLTKGAQSVLPLILSQARALGGSVIGALQEPTKDVIPQRDLFSLRVCLRATSAGHVDMVLGEDMRRRGALADEIPNAADSAGIGFVVKQRSRTPDAREGGVLRRQRHSESGAGRRVAAHRTRPGGGVIEALAREQPAGPRQPRQVRRLSKRLEVARQVHDLEQDVALDIVDIERLRVSVTRCLWFFLALGSVFTTTGVQNFLAGDLSVTDPVWWGCWGVEPCLVGILITVLRWEAAMIARDIDIDSRAVDWLKRFLLCSMLVTNVVPALWPRDGGVSAGMLAAHLMVPILVFFLAEVMPIVQARCTQARRAIALPDRTPTAAPLPPGSTTLPAAPAAVATEARPTPAVVDTPAAEPAMPALDGLGLPPAMQARLHQLAADLDRPVTAVDVQQATRLPLSIAVKVADRLTVAMASS